jgi:hypothetical protein
MAVSATGVAVGTVTVIGVGDAVVGEGVAVTVACKLGISDALEPSGSFQENADTEYAKAVMPRRIAQMTIKRCMVYLFSGCIGSIFVGWSDNQQVLRTVDVLGSEGHPLAIG